ncbi:nucleotidyl transferase AbiEii/AbiGii toxin family protein [Brooklawnia cerclae]|uniref:Nucleotidyl transferase AbiEii/AbiGii toxin family protein n=1 Tax=Brooklawnia cerclae TaxID=349934 RepID=A0ABX0SHZ4_9ACTN|nr:nucleotidyl transferase AbiEii/AbiGii toxin family protein [Brooklawnia cerclae]NIH57595.1 hypothetical protein [Brooklawnia cerclae]
MLRLYILEGFLARLAAGDERESLILKGGVLLAAFGIRRSTRDVDLAALHLSNETVAVLDLVRTILATVPAADDGIEFDLDSLTAQTIRDEDEYSGVRVGATAHLASAVISFHADVNVGDPIWPEPEHIHLPRLLGGADLELVGYPLPMVHAEKIVTAIQRGTANTRWRDFGDIWALSRRYALTSLDLQQAIGIVADHRNAVLGPLADILDGYADLAQPRWARWRHRSSSDHLPEEFTLVLNDVVGFADPVLLRDVDRSVWDPASRSWQQS